MASQTLLLIGALTFTVVFAGIAAAYIQATNAVRDEATARVLAVAHTVASDPLPRAALLRPDPSSELAPYAESVRKATGTDFVVIMSTAGVRYSHPDPTKIGGTYLGHIEAAQQGGQVVENFVGTLGPSRRAVVPVLEGTRVIALVAVGIQTRKVSEQVRKQLAPIAAAGLLAGILAGLGTLSIARQVRRATRGLSASRLKDMYDYYDAVLHSVREGLLIVDPQNTVRLVNDEAIRLLDLTDDPAQRNVAALGLPHDLVRAITDANAHTDDLHCTDRRVLVVNKARASWQGHDVGSVVTIRDRTDLEDLMGELDQTRSMADALRSSAHEASNRLHTMVSLIELGHPDQAVDFATTELSHVQALTDAVLEGVADPTISALLLGKAAQGAELGIRVDVGPDLYWPADFISARDAVTIVGNLIDNAFEALATHRGERRVSVSAQIEAGHLTLVIADNGPGIPARWRTHVLQRGFSTKDAGSGRRGLGLALVHHTVSRLGGTIAISAPPGAVITVRLPLALYEEGR